MALATGNEIAHGKHLYDEAIEMNETVRPPNARNANTQIRRRANVQDAQAEYDDLHLPQSIGFKRNDIRWLQGITVVLIAVTVVLLAVITFLGIREGTDGRWSTWGSWSECSSSCGTGMTSRNRSCSNPKPSNGGDHCFGDSTEYLLCNKVPCPARNCKDLMDKGDTTTGFKIILPDGISPIRVLCIVDVEQGGWTVIQKRESATDFYRNWQEYRKGFGDDNNFWLRLDNIHRLTAQGNYELRIDMVKPNNQTAAAKYKIFSVGNETMLYKLSIGNYSFDPTLNDPGDSFLNHNGMKFSTYDKDNDAYPKNCSGLFKIFYVGNETMLYKLSIGNFSFDPALNDQEDSFLYHNGMNFTTYDNDNDAYTDGNCAVSGKGGYWYNSCHYNNLNGLYGSTAKRQGINWKNWTGFNESLKYTRMMIRPN